MKILLNNQQYSKPEAKQKARLILNNNEINSTLKNSDFNFIYDILKLHAEANEKIGCGVEKIIIQLEKRFFTRHFSVVRKDGSIEDFSYISCLYHKSARTDKINAFRHEIIDEVMKFKKEGYGSKKYVRCAITGLNIQKKDCHVDHKAPLTLQQLVSNFLKENSLTLEEIRIKPASLKVEEVLTQLVDRSLADKWKNYHKKHAVLQLVLDHANLGQAKVKINWKGGEEKNG